MMELKAHSLSELHKEIDSLIFEACEKVVTRAAQVATEKAQENFSKALYAGTNDVSVSHQILGECDARVEATGHAVAFIEYGTGTMYQASTPEGAAEYGVEIGTYGKGKGANPPWYYYGEMGTMPDSLVVRTDGPLQVVRTFGNPSNLCLHLAKQYVAENIQSIAKEALK